MNKINKLILIFTLCFSSSLIAESNNSRPNIIFILTDDQRYDEIAAVGNFPWLKTPNLDKMLEESIHFENAFVTTSLCGPSRASFLTGVYANRHGVVANEYLDYDKSLPTFATLLQDSGYNTAYFGKWHQAMNNRPRPGFTKWMVFWGQGKYFNDTLMTENGEDFVIPKGKYLTDQLNELAVDFINDAEKKDAPFMLYLSHKALHEPFTPPDRHKSLYSDIQIPSQDNPNDDLDSKPRYIRETAIKNRLRGGGLAPIHWKIPDKMRTVTAVDEGVGMIFDTLKEKGILQNTIVIFAGDNGYFVSEHGGLHDKRKAYEPSIRIPLIMWNPFEEQPRKIDSLALNIDLAPYICEVADIPIPEHMQGISWEAILRGEDEGRDGFLYEYYKEIDYRPAGGFGGTPTTIAYRTKDWKLITYPENDYTKELYKISEDPEELYNLVNDKKYTTVLNNMDESLSNLLLDIYYKVPQKVKRL